MSTHTGPEYDLIVVGGGPRAVSLIERLIARAPHRLLRVAVIDRFEVGAGATWRTDQTPHFLNNTYAAHTTIYPDASTPMSGPRTAGPDLVQWAREIGHGWVPGRSDSWQAPPRPTWVSAEAAALAPWSYPTRRLQGVYYREQLQDILARGALHLEAVVGTVVALTGTEAVRAVELDDGRELSARHVVLAQGMVQALPDAAEKVFAATARAEGLTYIPPGMPSERDWSILGEGEVVLAAGLGANFFDIITLLTAGRGGVFTPVTGPFDLRYTPSGREPRFVAGSRRGLPYRSKSHYGALPEPYAAHLATDEWFAELSGAADLDFARDVWPMFQREFTAGHLATLAAHHPEEIPGVRPREGAWPDPGGAPLPADLLRRIEQTPTEELAGLVAGLVPDAEYHFDPARLDRPDVHPGESWQAWQRRWVRAERASITDPYRSPRASVNRAMARLRARLARVVAAGAIDPVSEHRDIEGWFAGISLALASGPPPERTARLLALVEAGIVDLLGEGSQFDVEEGAFRARSPVRGEIHARALIETRMSKGAVDRTDDPLINYLKDAGRARLHVKENHQGGRVVTQTLDVTKTDFALIGTDGRADRRVRVLGIPAGDVQPGSAIGATPGVPSPLLAGADLVAAQVLAELGSGEPAVGAGALNTHARR